MTNGSAVSTTREMISVESARGLIAQHVSPQPAARVPLAQAHRRVLAEAAVANEEMPAFDRSAVDGYAWRADDPVERFRVVAEIEAGAVCERAIGPGECARIFTGAALPNGATAVLMQEHAARDGGWITPTRRTRETNIRHRGDDAHSGDQLVAAGTRLGPIELSMLAQLGATSPLVFPAPRVLHVATGAELVDPSEAPRAGQLRDSNSTLVRALLAESGTELVAQTRCGDQLDALLSAIREQPDHTWDFLLISGGASVGDYDFGARALRELGFTLHFEKLNLRPGKPLIFATRGRQAVFVIPGNPLSHFVCYHLLISYALAIGAGNEPLFEIWNLPLGGCEPLRGHSRETWCPARVERSGASIGVAPLHWQSSGDITRLAGVDALIRIPSDSAPLPVGELVACLLLDRCAR